ncbi:MAG TPA: DUF192 domain-containing protein [Candidatus Paceibacterota bacterium]|nr:DUF192 domain-containing protein [Candidatus Paceibacterota bacterium]
MKIEISLGGKRIILNSIKKTNFFSKFSGLMFRRKEKSNVLLFETGKRISIHSFFVFFEFVCLWLDNENNVLEWKIIKPFSVREISNYKFTKIIEIPINRKCNELVNLIVGERFKKENHL